MANIIVKDASAATIYLKASGAGSSGDPAIPEHATTLLTSAAVIGHVILDAGTAAFGKLAANSGVIIGDVNLVSAIPAGTNGIGKLTANSGVIIGDVNLVSSIPAGTNGIGKLTSNSGVVIGDVNINGNIANTAVSVTPTVSTSPAYTAKDAIGGKMTFSNCSRAAGGSGIIQSVMVVDQNAQKQPMDLVLFNADPSGTTFTDNSALDIADADMSKIIGVVHITDYSDFNDNSLGQALNLGIPWYNSQTIYGGLVARGTPTFAATTDIIVTLNIIQN